MGSDLLFTHLAGIFKTFLLFSALTVNSSELFAQLSASDSILYQKSFSNAVKVYQHSLEGQSGLYNGSEYPGYPFSFKTGHPFFYSEKPGNGSIVYDMIAYPGIILQYDEVAEEVILYESNHRIQLLRERIARFSILENYFVRIVKDSLAMATVSTGFYQLLYEGQVSLLKKEVKTIAEELRSVSEGILRNIEIKLYYYIQKDNIYHPVKGKKDILAVFKDRKKEIQQYIRVNKLNFRKDSDTMLIKVTVFYDQLTK